MHRHIHMKYESSKNDPKSIEIKSNVPVGVQSFEQGEAVSFCTYDE